jgi:signal transduction histidine kinase
MSELASFQRAYEREKLARMEAERLLDEKSRELYKSVVTLEDTLQQLEKTQEQLIRSEKMASIGQLVAGVAHEINNPIGFVLSNTKVASDSFDSLLALDRFVMTKMLPKLDESLVRTYLAQREAQEIGYLADDVDGLMGDSVDGLHRIKDIVDNLKCVSHPGNGCFEQCDINDCIEKSLKMVHNELKYKMQVVKQLDPLPCVAAQSAQIQQVFINMFVNAAHACERNGILTLKTYLADKDGVHGVMIHIEDNGHGMSKGVQRRIFDPFYTTKGVGEGTGLGLSISFGIIQKHQGCISVNSMPGQGSEFCIFLPALREGVSCEYN